MISQLGFLSVLLFIFSLPPVRAEENSFNEKPKIEWGGLIDTAAAYDFNRPNTLDSGLFTHPARHAEFNVSMASVDVKITHSKYRGHFALQAGTAVQAAYVNEPLYGTISGPTLSRHIQEANVGYQFLEGYFVEAGIFLSHFGSESFITRDNPTYTRSLLSENSPFFESGVRVTGPLSKKLSFQLWLTNGWGTISTTSEAKSFETQLAYEIEDTLVLKWNSFSGSDIRTNYRFYNDLELVYYLNDQFRLSADLAYGTLAFKTGGFGSWYGSQVTAHYELSPLVDVSCRAETLLDPNGSVVTGSPAAFNAYGGSVGADIWLAKQLMFRNEFRGLVSANSIFPYRSEYSTNLLLITTGLTLWF